ncbi:Glycosyl transferases group 1 [Microbacterium sp. cf046]|uniref:glycosyltransferase family protein n=1 Tax=Microbacterium sp. cf046 TaxID=1761803 RepID=UPI0008E00858|nr:glycosyltransferase [Microbacterium sp. cf046]SFR95710.1 Glycosyl transferases group 1 [Microbacterium sp. cf046]
MGIGSRVTQSMRSVVDAVLRHRDRLPGFVNRGIDHIADSPDGFFGRLAARSLGSFDDADIPPPTSVPDASLRVYIAPTNYAAQGWAWARALDAAPDDVGARNMAVDVPGGFSFEADTVVPVPVYTSSELWQRAELEAVGRFTHALFEAERPFFGRLFSRDVATELEVLAARGVSTAFMCHGSDIRLPSRHLDFTPWSPFGERSASNDKLERDAARNRALLDAAGRPVFVSTPDLLADVPYGLWCPVVVDPARWAAVRETGPASQVSVAHAPSKSQIKGTPLIEPVVERLAEAGVIRYRRVSGVPSADMPAVYAEADIVLDQFRLGSYGVAACEAMAAGCVVVGHVVPAVRDAVAQVSGLELPIVEADPDSLDDVLRGLAADPGLRATIAERGRAFVAEVHDGGLSARIMLDRWILS